MKSLSILILIECKELSAKKVQTGENRCKSHRGEKEDLSLNLPKIYQKLVKRQNKVGSNIGRALAWGKVTYMT